MSLVPVAPVMSQPRLTRRRPNRQRRSRDPQKVPSTALVYRGPTRLPSVNQQNDLMTTQINNSGTLTTTAGGVLATVFDSYSQLSTPGDWASLTNLYTEYRVLSMEVEFLPWNTYNMPTTTVLPPLYSVLDRSNNTPLGSIAQAMGYDSVMGKEASKKFRRVIKMASTDEAVWTPVGSGPATASRMYLKLYGTGFTGSTNLYDFITRIVVQLRGRQ